MFVYVVALNFKAHQLNKNRQFREVIYSDSKHNDVPVNYDPPTSLSQNHHHLLQTGL